MLLALADLKAVLHIAADDESADPALTAVGNAVTEAIQSYCGRVFEVPESAGPVTRDATARDILEIPDTLSIVNLTAYGAPLTAGTDYHLLTNAPLAPYTLSALYPHYSRIRRVQAGQAVGWDTGSTGTDWLQAITYDAIEAYAATVPARVTLAAQVLATQLWARRVREYTDDLTAQASALIVGLVADLLHDLKAAP
jgi:hypothetical protein